MKNLSGASPKASYLWHCRPLPTHENVAPAVADVVVVVVTVVFWYPQTPYQGWEKASEHYLYVLLAIYRYSWFKMYE